MAWQAPAGKHSVEIGGALQAALDALDGGHAHSGSLTEYYSFRYHLKPESVDPKKPGRIEGIDPKSDGSVTFRMENGSTQGVEDRHQFNGTQNQAKDFECVLIYDEATGQFTLEKLDSCMTLSYDKHVVKNPRKSPTEESPATAFTSTPTPPTHVSDAHRSDRGLDVEVIEPRASSTLPPPPSFLPAKPPPEVTNQQLPPPLPPNQPTPTLASKTVPATVKPPTKMTLKGKSKRSREETDPSPLPPPKRASPTKTHPLLPLSLPSLPPPPPPRRPTPDRFGAADGAKFVFSDDEDGDKEPELSKGLVLTVDEGDDYGNSISGDMFEESEGDGLEEVDDNNMDSLFDVLDEGDGEEGEAEGEEEEEFDFETELQEAFDDSAAPQLHQSQGGKKPMSLNAFAGGAVDDDDDDDDDEETSSSEEESD